MEDPSPEITTTTKFNWFHRKINLRSFQKFSLNEKTYYLPFTEITASHGVQILYHLMNDKRTITNYFIQLPLIPCTFFQFLQKKSNKRNIN